MTKFKIVLTGVLFALLLSGLACQAFEYPPLNKPVAVPAAWVGKWQVTQVLTDKGDTVVCGMDAKYWIPRYLGRLFTITATQLSINAPEDNLCKEPALFSCQSTAAQIIAKSIWSRFSDKDHPTPQDMGLPLANDAPVEVLYLTCQGVLLSKDRDHKVYLDLSNATWFIELGNDQLAMSWHDQTVLILSRLPENAKPVASFDCAKARTDAEKTICSDVGLAAYDQSVAQVYKLILSYYQSKPNTEIALYEHQTYQRDWIVQRDKCGNDVACLESAMDQCMDIQISDLDGFMKKRD